MKKLIFCFLTLLGIGIYYFGISGLVTVLILGIIVLCMIFPPVMAVVAGIIASIAIIWYLVGAVSSFFH